MKESERIQREYDALGEEFAEDGVVRTVLRERIRSEQESELRLENEAMRRILHGACSALENGYPIEEELFFARARPFVERTWKAPEPVMSVEEESPEQTLESALLEFYEACKAYFEVHGAEHEVSDCPEDDTCECLLIGKVNAAFAAVERVKGAK
jgi:hypothetical protein